MTLNSAIARRRSRTHIGDDFVVVIAEDELEVQRVQMYEYIKE